MQDSNTDSTLTHRNTKVDSSPPGSVIRIVGIGCPGPRDVDDARDLVIFKDFTKLSLVFDWDHDLLDGQVGLVVDVVGDFGGWGFVWCKRSDCDWIRTCISTECRVVKLAKRKHKTRKRLAGLARLTMRVEMEAETHQTSSYNSHFRPVDITSKQDTRVWSGEFESVDREESSPVCFMDVFTERSDFSCRSHF